MVAFAVTVAAALVPLLLFLKKRAEVTLYECRPKKTGEAVRAKFEERVLKQTRRMGGDLLEYNVDTGVWRFALQL